MAVVLRNLRSPLDGLRDRRVQRLLEDAKRIRRGAGV